MSEREFGFKGQNFKLNKIDAIKQFHIVRRIAPVLSELLPAMKESTRLKSAKDIEALSEEKQLEIIAKFAGPVMMGLSKLSDDDAELVLYGLLNSVEIQQKQGNWARVASEKLLMMQDMELPTLLQLAGRAFMYNLSNFFAALPQ